MVLLFGTCSYQGSPRAGMPLPPTPGFLNQGQRQEEKGMTDDEMVGWHHRLNRHEFG